MADNFLYYLAAPYSHPDKAVIDERMEIFCKVDARLIDAGYHTVSPLSKHFILNYGYNLGGDWAYWGEYSKKLLSLCHAMFVICIDGWETSVGVLEEIKLARQLNIEVIYLDTNGIRIDGKL